MVFSNVVVDVGHSSSVVFGQSRTKISASFTNVSSLAVAAFDLVYSQAAQAHYVWVGASEVIWSEYTRIIIVYYLMLSKRKNLKDKKSSCLSVCTCSL